MKCLINEEEELGFYPVKDLVVKPLEVEEKKKVPFVRVLSPLTKDIIDALKKSIFSSDIDEKIYWWKENNKKYFISDKGEVYSLSVYKSDFKAHVDEETRDELLFTRYDSLAQLENTLALYRENKKVFMCWQVRKLEPANGRLALKVMSYKVADLKKRGFKVEKRFNDQTCKYDYFVNIQKNVLLQMFRDNLETVPPVENKRRSKVFEVNVNGKYYIFKSQKECYETLFKEKMSLRTFKTLIKKNSFQRDGLNVDILSNYN